MAEKVCDLFAADAIALTKFDFGKGKVGKVLDIRGWDNESSRSVANVAWFSGSTNVYRLGHKGNCDIKFVEPASGGTYYPEHLPVLGQNMEQTVVRPTRLGPPPFNVGDKVQVTVSEDRLKALQQGHGGWNPRMAEVNLFYFYHLSIQLI